MDPKISQKKGTLFIVPTPIGNLDDITLRALQTLKKVDLIAAEDTRHSKKLLSHFAIHTPLISYYREKEAERSAEILFLLREGKDIALISDAGTPTISDPGAILVQCVHENGVPLVVLPGPSALTAAVSGSGFIDNGFLFLGFLPAKKGQRQKVLSSIVNSKYPVVLYVSPHRIDTLLGEALEILGERKAFLARELSKKFEELQKDTLSSLLTKAREGRNRGEFVLIIGPGLEESPQGETLEELILWYKNNSQLSLKDVCRRLAEDLGLSRSHIYQQALTLWHKPTK